MYTIRRINVPHKKKNNRQKKKQLRKESTTTEQRSSKKQISTAAIHAVKKVLEILKPFELSRSQRHRTYQTMLLDDAVWSSFDSRAMAIERAQASGKFKYKKDSPVSKEIRDFLSYNMKNMTNQTSRSIGRCSAEMIIHGGAPFEKVFHKQSGEYSDHFTLKKLSYIHPLSLDQSAPYVTDDKGNSIVALRQSSSAFVGNDGISHNVKNPKGYVDIDTRRIAFCAYSATDTNPIGTSPLDAAYVAWREKQLLQDYLLIGVTRDFSGTPVLRLPSEVLSAAEEDPASSEAQQVLALSTGMADMHSGDASFMILPSDSQSESGTGLRDYEIQFLGVEGGGKGFDITEIIEQKKRAIYNVLASQHLITGENGGGSYNLSEGTTNMTSLFSGRDNMIVDEMWNKQVFPQLLRLNSIEYTQEELPVWESGEVQPVSLSEKGQYFNRVMRSLPAVADVVNILLEDIGADYRVPEDATPDQIREMTFDFQEEAKVGSGEGSSGTGSKVQGNSDSNKQNK